MSRWDTNLDSPVIPDGDRFFNAWNSKLHRSLLPEGSVPVSQNKRFTDNRAAPRKGSIMPNGNKFWYKSDNTQKFLGSFVFTNQAGKERIILCPTALRTGTVGINCYDIENDQYITIQLPPRMTIGPNSIVWFAQGPGGNLIMLVSDRWNGVNTPHVTNGLFWDGNEATRLFQWFTWNGIPTTQVIPPSVVAWPVSGRMAYALNYLPPGDVPHFSINGTVVDHILMSDVWGAETGAFMNMDPVLQDFIINPTTTDQIMSIVPYAFDAVIIGMRRSINMLSNFSFDPNLAQTQILTSYMGVCAIRGMLQIGTEVYFVSERRGVFKLTEILDQRITVPPLPLSDSIQPDIDRINWPYANYIVLASEDNYLYMAAPIDGARFCNAIFVMNLTTGNWETIDKFNIPFFRIDNLLAVHISGVRRLVAVQNGPPALIYLLYEGSVDQTVFDVVNPRFTAVSDYMETRGYGIRKDADPTAWGTFHRGSVVMETVNPNVQITAITEGVGERKIVRSSITKDSTKYYIHSVPPQSPPFDDEKRQDYSISPTTQPNSFDAQDFEQMPVGDLSGQNQLVPPVFIPGTDPWAVPAQTSRERFRIRMTDRWLSLGIGNTQGKATIVATNVEMTESRRSRTAA